MCDLSLNRRFFAVVLLVLCLGSPGSVLAGVALDGWRGEIGQVRGLAENNVPLAYKEAQRLYAELPAGATAFDRVRALNLLARTEVYMALSEQAKKHAQLALELAAQNADRAGQAEADINIGLSSVNLGDINTLVAVSTHSLAVLDGVDRPDLLGEALLRASVMLRRTGQFDESVTMAIRAMEIAKLTKDPLVLTYAHQGMGIAFEQSDRPEEAHEHFLNMHKQARAARSQILEADALASLAAIAKTRGQLHEADKLIREAVTLYRKVGAPFNLARGLFALADILRSQGRHAEAIKLLSEAIAIHQGHANRIGLWWALNARSDAYRDTGNAAAMRADTERAAALAKELNLSLYLSESAQRMAEIAAADGDLKSAYRLSVEAAKMANKADREKASARMLQLAQHYESDSKQHQIDDLNRSNERQIAEDRQRWLWSMLGGCFVLLAITGFFLRHLTRSNRLLEKTNEQLLQSQKNQQAILDAVPDTLFDLGMDGRCYSFHSLRTSTRASPFEAFVGKTLFDALPGEAAEICLSALREAQERGMSTGKQFELSSPHGKHWFELSVSRKHPEPGEMSRFIVIARDISQRKFAEQYEQFRSHILELLSRGDSLPAILEGIVRGVEQLNPAMICSILLLDSQGKHLGNGIAPSLPDFYNAAIEGVEIGIGVGSCGTAAASGERVIVADIQTHPYWASFKELAARAGVSACWSQPIRSYSGHVLGTFATYHHEVHVPTVFDISIIEQAAHLASIAIERKRTDEALHASEQKFRSLAENFPDILIRYDREGRRSYVNPALERMFGIPAKQTTGLTPQEANPAKLPEHYQNALKHTLATGERSEFEMELHVPSGEMGVGFITIAAERDGNGEICGAITIGRDISKLKWAEQQLRELTAHLESVREEEKARLAREIHDDLGSTLAALKLKLSHLLDFELGGEMKNTSLFARLESMSRILEHAIAATRRIITDMRPDVLDNLGLFAALKWQAEQFYKHTGIMCRIVCANDLGCADCRDCAYQLDKTQSINLFRIFQEALTNVARHSGAASVVAEYRPGVSHVLLSICDDGCGLPDGHVPSPTSFGMRGMRERVGQLGGKITFDNALGGGLCVTVRLPLTSGDKGGTGD